MGIIPTIVVFFLVTVANIINTRYLIESNEGLKRRQLPMKDGLKIDNDYANLMYQVYSALESNSRIAFRTSWLLCIPSLLLPYRMGCNVGNDDFNGGLLKSSSLPRNFLRRPSSAQFIIPCPVRWTVLHFMFNSRYKVGNKFNNNNCCCCR